MESVGSSSPISTSDAVCDEQCCSLDTGRNTRCSSITSLSVKSADSDSCQQKFDELGNLPLKKETKSNGINEKNELLTKYQDCNGGAKYVLEDNKCDIKSAWNERLPLSRESCVTSDEELAAKEILDMEVGDGVLSVKETQSLLTEKRLKSAGLELSKEMKTEEGIHGIEIDDVKLEKRDGSTYNDQFSSDCEKPKTAETDADDILVLKEAAKKCPLHDADVQPKSCERHPPNEKLQLDELASRSLDIIKDLPNNIDDGSISNDSNLPIDMTMASVQRMQAAAAKSAKTETKPKSDGLRPVGRLLHDLGLDLVRQQVYKDLIGIQEGKDSKNMLDEKEKEQLKRLTDAHSKLIVKNAVFDLPIEKCRCSFSSSSTNVMTLHHEYGSTFEVPFHACCICENFKTRWPSQFVVHLDSLHQKKGRVQGKAATNVCKYCPYEHKNMSRMEVHTSKCFKKFNLNTNLQPLPADCDVPLLARTSTPASNQPVRSGAVVGPISFPTPPPVHGTQQTPKQVVTPTASSGGVQPTVMEIGGQLYSLVHHNGKALFTSLRSQINGSGSSQNTSTPPTGMAAGNFPRFLQPPSKPVAKAPPVQHREKCEMCDAMVNDREALWNHFRMLHRVELSKVSMMEKEPWMNCDICMAKFWTYQGLTRHSMQLHKREIAPPGKTFKCFLCLQVQSNPLNHLSTYHNITLLDMYHSRRCCMCNRRFRAAPAFEEHMVLQHHDIFANKDVLCTVLQALSTALSLKRQETIQHRVTAPAPTPSIKTGQRHNAQSSTGHVQHLVSTTSSPGQRNVLELPSSSKTQSETKKRGGHRRQSGDRSKETETSTSSKSPPKKSNEEDTKELIKLYTEYADIGRPILRSMRHRLSQGGSEKALTTTPTGSKATTPTASKANSTKTGTDAVKVDGDSTSEPGQKSEADTDLSEPSAKRLCLESHKNNVEPKGLDDTDHQKQSSETNAETVGTVVGEKTSVC